MVRPAGKPVASMRFWLLALLIPGIVTLLGLDSWNDYRSLYAVTQEAYDNALLEPAKVLEGSVEFNEDGSLRIDPPFYAQVMLESQPGNRKYFRVEDITGVAVRPAGPAKEGQTLLGMKGLPRPPALSDIEGMPVFYDGMFRSDMVRMVAVWRDLHRQGNYRRVLVMVGESTESRERAQQQAWREALFRDLRMVFLMCVLVWLSVLWALRPLTLLTREIRARKVDDLKPLDPSYVPPEVVPLVNAVNHHIGLYRAVLERQEQFLADASHQLRTPLAIMRTQAQYARREPDVVRTRETLDAIIAQLGRTTRLTEQLLSLAHASQHEHSPGAKVDLNALARDVVLQYLPLARERRQDLGWIDCAEAPDGPEHVWVLGDEAELHEVLANLVHNALNHSFEGCSITVAAGRSADSAWVSVSDNGPGLAPALRESVFVRFARGGRSRHPAQSGGSGLGLAIARAYAQRNGGTITLEDGDPNPQQGVGLRAVLRMPSLAGA